MIAAMHASAAGLLIGAIVLSACGPSDRPDAQSRSAPRTPTFNRDVAPILFEHCGSCHRPASTEVSVARADGRTDPLCIAGAPFSLIEYADASRYARQVAEAVRSRRMPPWLPEHGYGDFANERRLRDDQIEIIQRWVDQGAVEGAPSDKPPTPAWPRGWQLGQPDLVLNMADVYTLPAGEADVFRNFVFQVPLPSTRYVRAIEFRTDNSRVLHHASVAVDPARISRKLDRVDKEPGFASMPDDEVQNVFGWSPGKAPFMEPADRAWTLEKGSDLVVQMHMLPGGTPEVIRPSIGLFFTDTPPTRVPIVIALQSKTIDIPAGERHYAIEDRYVLPADVDLISIYPHAHYLATEMKGEAALPDGTVKPLIWIKAWNFNWQDKYAYASPLSLPAGTTLSMRFTYDNSDLNPNRRHRPARPVSWGPQSSDEMGALWLEVLPRQAAGRAVLMKDYARRAMQADISAAEMLARKNAATPFAHNFLAARYLQAGRIPEAVAQLDEALRLNPDDAEAHSNLGIALQLQGRLGDALTELREAARLKPEDDRVHVNLGNVMQAGGRADDAISQYRQAIAINPENADAHFNLALMLGPRGRLAEAIVHLRRAVAINPQKADVHRNLGLALSLQGHTDEAIEEFREALRIQPDSVEAQKNLREALNRR
jgi:Flp pilus assembly protein TadD